MLERFVLGILAFCVSTSAGAFDTGLLTSGMTLQEITVVVGKTGRAMSCGTAITCEYHSHDNSELVAFDLCDGKLKELAEYIKNDYEYFNLIDKWINLYGQPKVSIEDNLPNLFPKDNQETLTSRRLVLLWDSKPNSIIKMSLNPIYHESKESKKLKLDSLISYTDTTICR